MEENMSPTLDQGLAHKILFFAINITQMLASLLEPISAAVFFWKKKKNEKRGVKEKKEITMFWWCIGDARTRRYFHSSKKKIKRKKTKKKKKHAKVVVCVLYTLFLSLSVLFACLYVRTISSLET